MLVPLGNVLTTWTGSWTAVFVIAAILNIVAAVMALAVLMADATPSRDIGLPAPQRTLGRLSQSEPALFGLLLLPALDRLPELLVLLRHLREAVLPELLRPGPVPLRRFLARLLEIVLGRHRLPSRGEVARSRRRAKLPGGCLGARKLRAFHESTLSRGPLSSLRGERRGAAARESGQLTRDAGRPQKTIWGYVVSGHVLSRERRQQRDEAAMPDTSASIATDPKHWRDRAEEATRDGGSNERSGNQKYDAGYCRKL